MTAAQFDDAEGRALVAAIHQRKAAKTMAEVLAAHWSRSTFTDHNPHVDKCDGCGAVIYTWGDDPTPGGIEPLATHQADALTAAGFGLIRGADGS